VATESQPPEAGSPSPGNGGPGAQGAEENFLYGSPPLRDADRLAAIAHRNRVMAQQRAQLARQDEEDIARLVQERGQGYESNGELVQSPAPGAAAARPRSILRDRKGDRSQRGNLSLRWVDEPEIFSVPTRAQLLAQEEGAGIGAPNAYRAPTAQLRAAAAAAAEKKWAEENACDEGYDEMKPWHWLNCVATVPEFMAQAMAPDWMLHLLRDLVLRQSCRRGRAWRPIVVADWLPPGGRSFSLFLVLQTLPGQGVGGRVCETGGDNPSAVFVVPVCPNAVRITLDVLGGPTSTSYVPVKVAATEIEWLLDFFAANGDCAHWMRLGIRPVMPAGRESATEQPPFLRGVLEVDGDIKVLSALNEWTRLTVAPGEVVYVSQPLALNPPALVAATGDTDTWRSVLDDSLVEAA